MNGTQEREGHDARTGLIADPGRIAPHLDKGWRDDFIVELRLLRVTGDRIGDALVTADSHVADSGEGAREAFGDPVAYAREIARGAGPGDGWRVNGWTVAGNVAGLVGMLAAVRALTGWLEGGPVAVTVGDGVALLLLLLLVAAVLRWSTAVIRVVVEHRVLVPVLAPVVLVGAFAAVYWMLRATWFEVGVLPLALTAGALVAASVVASWVDAPPDGDQIVAPGRQARPSVWSRLGGTLVLPFLTLLLLAVTWVVHALA